MPSEALWKRAAHELQSTLVSAIGFNPMTGSSYPSLVMVAYAIAYLVIVVGLAIRLFERRDL